LLRKYKKKLGITTILVTHDQADAFSVADRIMVMNNRVLQQIGTPDEIYSSPANIFVASFIGDPPMNIFEIQRARDLLSSFRSTYNAELNNIYIGFRPEEAYIAPPSSIETSGVTRLTGKIDVIEHYGARAFALVIVNEDLTVKAQINPNTRLNIGDSCEVHINRLHIFNGKTGERIASL
jgi:ABC-type sugar transport system ATPase subunit